MCISRVMETQKKQQQLSTWWRNSAIWILKQWADISEHKMYKTVNYSQEVWLKLEICVRTMVTAPMFQKCVLIENWRYSKINRSGHNCHQKDSFLLTIPKRRGHAAPCRATQGGTSISWEAEEEWKMWARAFTVLSMGRNERGMVSRFRIGQFE